MMFRRCLSRVGGATPFTTTGAELIPSLDREEDEEAVGEGDRTFCCTFRGGVRVGGGGLCLVLIVGRDLAAPVTSTAG